MRGLPVVPPLVTSLVGVCAKCGEIGNAGAAAEGRMILLIGLDVVGVVDRQFDDVVEAPDVAGLEPGLVPEPGMERVVPADLHDREEALVLQSADALRRPL